jgi:hypothetical protein
MSLRSFHIVFIVTATLFCLGFGGWGVVRYQSGYAPGAWYAAMSFVAGAALIPYLTSFIRTTRHAA